MTPPLSRDELIELRRDLHRYPEPAWCEYYTTSRLVDAIEEIGVDELHLGRDVHADEQRMALPPKRERERWYDRAVDRDARSDVLEQARGGFTGGIAVLRQGPGPVVALRVDMDALYQSEATTPTHRPQAAAFRSTNDGVMHACGHDGHMAIGVGVLQAIKDSEFDGVFKLLFQPAEETAGGAKSMAASGHVDDVDYFFGLHLGLGRPTGSLVAGIVKPLAVSNFDVEFTGQAAHAGNEPHVGKNCMQAAATAVQELYAIPRHSDGVTRVNIGQLESGTSPNAIAASASLRGEVRGETNAIHDYMERRFRRIIRATGEMHECDADIEITSDVPRVDSDRTLSKHVAEVAAQHDAITDIDLTAEFGASEDATHLMQAVEGTGGSAVYSIIGTDHPGGHHSPTFDIDEQSIGVGIEILTDAISRIDALESATQ
ncbi:amidohydrolase [Natrononativus amylolyticus]|uniref:amidohydrolase n=1 Tax=Natrononativus amylolyticus TaxID=2963434 RepID=UPI0020CED55D|nr:amidohydrolase [Natrononativus amylolyticus]